MVLFMLGNSQAIDENTTISHRVLDSAKDINDQSLDKLKANFISMLDQISGVGCNLNKIMVKCER